MVDDPIQQLIVLSDANLALAEEIQALVNQARAEAALEQASVKTQTLVNNVTEARRVVHELQDRPTPTED